MDISRESYHTETSYLFLSLFLSLFIRYLIINTTTMLNIDPLSIRYSRELFLYPFLWTSEFELKPVAYCLTRLAQIPGELFLPRRWVAIRFVSRLENYILVKNEERWCTQAMLIYYSGILNAACR